MLSGAKSDFCPQSRARLDAVRPIGGSSPLAKGPHRPNLWPTPEGRNVSHWLSNTSISKTVERITEEREREKQRQKEPGIHRYVPDATGARHTLGELCWWRRCVSAASRRCYSSDLAPRSDPECTAAPAWSCRSQSLPRSLSPAGFPPCLQSARINTHNHKHTCTHTHVTTSNMHKYMQTHGTVIYLLPLKLQKGAKTRIIWRWQTHATRCIMANHKRSDLVHAKYSTSHHMVIKPFLLHGPAAEYRSRRWMWSTLPPIVRSLWHSLAN